MRLDLPARLNTILVNLGLGEPRRKTLLTPLNGLMFEIVLGKVMVKLTMDYIHVDTTTRCGVFSLILITLQSK